MAPGGAADDRDALGFAPTQLLAVGRAAGFAPVGTPPGALAAREDRHGFVAGALLVVGLAAAVAPVLTTPVLPFQDHAGMVGLCAAQARASDPAARVAEFFTVAPALRPGSLPFVWCAALARAGVGAEAALQAFWAILGLAGPVLALLCLLRTAGRPWWLALLALPVAYHQQVWFGFLGSAASVTGIVLALTAALRAARRPSLANHVALAAALAFTALGHPFGLALALVVIAPLFVWPVARPVDPPQGAPATARARFLRVLAWRTACLVPALAILLPWLVRSAGGEAHGGSGAAGSADAARAGGGWASFFAALRFSEIDPARDGAAFLAWLGNGYRGWWDDVPAALAVATLGLVLVAGVRSGSARGAGAAGADGARDAGGASVATGGGTPGHAWLWLGWAAAALAVGFLVLPHAVAAPVRWWGVRYRCVAPLFLVLCALPRPRPRGLPAAAVFSAAAAALALFAFLSWDFGVHFRRRALDGFDRAIAAIPAGSSVLAMPALPDPRYTNGHPYVAQHFVARIGGRVVPYLVGHPGAYWTTQNPSPPSPPWGAPAEFSWAEHAAGYDHFLIELPMEGPPPAPFAAAPPGAVELVVAGGRWRLYRKAE